jgi:tRNA-2-methylthio-N6-dimethylallyladenosine synthase
MPGQVPKPIVQERFERLVELVNHTTLRENLAQVGRTVEVMFAAGEGRKDRATARMSGRACDNRLVHVAVPEVDQLRPRPGDIADVLITYAAPHHLTADAGLLRLRRTSGGDAWQTRQIPSGAPRQPVSLGIPTVGLPAPVEQSCS